MQRPFDPHAAILPQPLNAIVDFIYDHLLRSSDLRQYDRVTPERWGNHEEFAAFQRLYRELFAVTRLRTASFDEVQLLLTWMQNEQKHHPEIVFQSFTEGVLEAVCRRLAELAQTQEFFVARTS